MNSGGSNSVLSFCEVDIRLKSKTTTIIVPLTDETILQTTNRGLSDKLSMLNTQPKSVTRYLENVKYHPNSYCTTS